MSFAAVSSAQVHLLKTNPVCSPQKKKNHKIVFALAPADRKKEGPSFALPMAVGSLIASKCLPADVKGKLFVGELSLDGSVQAVNGVLPIVREAKRAGFNEVYVPLENAK